MLTEAFCLQHRVFVSQDAVGQWCLNYQPPLIPWVYLYVARLVAHPLNLREIEQGEFDLWLRHREAQDFRLESGAEKQGDSQQHSGKTASERYSFNHGFTELGLPEKMAKYLRQVIRRSQGLVLVTGPEGAGKSNTLTACLQQLSQRRRILLTPEDLMEPQRAALGQAQSYAPAADVVAFDELREGENVQTAVRLSSTHLVFSALAGYSATEAIGRLAKNVDPQLLASSLAAVINQRLVRKLCSYCRLARPLNKQQQRWLQLNDEQAEKMQLYHPVGCKKCGYRGYLGRVALFELVLMNSALRELIEQRASSEELTWCARRSLPGIEYDAQQKVLAGITSYAEAIRITRNPTINRETQTAAEQWPNFAWRTRKGTQRGEIYARADGAH